MWILVWTVENSISPLKETIFVCSKHVLRMFLTETASLIILTPAQPVLIFNTRDKNCFPKAFIYSDLSGIKRSIDNHDCVAKKQIIRTFKKGLKQPSLV